MPALVQLQNEAEFAKHVWRLAQLQSESLAEVIHQQAGLFTEDASSFTPPFAKAPIKESAASKRRQGLLAVRRDIRRIFVPLERLRLYKYARGKANKLGAGVRRAARKGDFHLVEALLRKANIRCRGVIKEPIAELHDAMRDKRGRVRKESAYLTVSGEGKLNSYIKMRQKLVGFAKDGWSKALHGLDRKVPGWVDEQSAGGLFIGQLAGDTPEITVGNPVGFIQWNAPRIEQQAWANRFRNAEKQTQILERAARKKLRESGIQAS